MGYYWSDERTTECVNLWNRGFSATEVARCLGGTTRNAVIGKIHRLGLSHRTTVVRSKQRGAGNRKDRKGKPRGFFDATLIVKSIPKVYEAPLPPEPERPETLVSLADLEDSQCRFIYGDPKSDYGFCGCQTATGSSYCEGHHHVVFTVPEPRRRKSSETPTHLFRLYDTGSRKEVEV